jgi:hypothetical protein
MHKERELLSAVLGKFYLSQNVTFKVTEGEVKLWVDGLLSQAPTLVEEMILYYVAREEALAQFCAKHNIVIEEIPSDYFSGDFHEVVDAVVSAYYGRPVIARITVGGWPTIWDRADFSPRDPDVGIIAGGFVPKTPVSKDVMDLLQVHERYFDAYIDIEVQIGEMEYERERIH